MVRHRGRRVDVRRQGVAFVDAQGRPGRAQPREPADRARTPGSARARGTISRSRPPPKARRPTTRTTSSRSSPRATARSGPAPGAAAPRASTARPGPTSPPPKAWPATSSTASRSNRTACCGSARTRACRATTARPGRTSARSEGLLEEHVYAVAVAPNGDVWAGTQARCRAHRHVGQAKGTQEHMNNGQRALVIGVAAVAIAVGLGGAYLLGRQSAVPAADAATAAEAGDAAAPIRRSPTARPPSRSAKARSRSTRRRKFVHFRVGNKNVKRILVDGDVVWVGTSGGADPLRQRAPTSSSCSTPRAACCPTAIFHVGQLDDRIVLGTYGGGLSLLDAEDRAVGDLQHPRRPRRRLRLRRAEGAERRRLDRHLVGRRTASAGGDLKDRSKLGPAHGRQHQGRTAERLGLRTRRGQGRRDLARRPRAASRASRTASWDQLEPRRAAWARRTSGSRPTSSTRATRRRSRSTTRGRRRRWGCRTSTSPTTPTTSCRSRSTRTASCGRARGAAGSRASTAQAGRNFTVADGLPGNHVFMLHIDPKGRLWVGTNNGLALRQPDGKFKVMTTHDGLFSNAVFSMATGARRHAVGRQLRRRRAHPGAAGRRAVGRAGNNDNQPRVCGA